MKYIKINISDIKSLKKLELSDTDILIYSYLKIVESKFKNKNISFSKIAEDLNISKSTVSRSIAKMRSAGVAICNEILLRCSTKKRCNMQQSQSTENPAKSLQFATARNNNISNKYTIDNDSDFTTETQNTQTSVAYCNTSVAQLQHQRCVIATPRNDNNNTQCHIDNNNNNDNNLSKFRVRLDIDLKERKYIKERKDFNFEIDSNSDLNSFNKEVKMKKYSKTFQLKFSDIVEILKRNGCNMLPTSVQDLLSKKSFYQTFLTPLDSSARSEIHRPDPNCDIIPFTIYDDSENIDSYVQ